MKKIIVSVLAIAGVCCYLDKTDKKLDDITSNDNVISTFEGMKKAGSFINNNEVYNTVKDTTISLLNDIKTNPKVQEISHNALNSINELIEKTKEK